MGRNSAGVQGDLFKDYMAKLDKIGGSEAMKKATEKGLKASKDYVTPLIETAMSSGNLPAQGKFSSGDTKRSINKDTAVNWSGLTMGEIKIGFDMKKSGLVSIFLMYGTPKMRPVSGLKNAIYGGKTQKEITKIQQEEVTKMIKEIMEGK